MTLSWLFLYVLKEDNTTIDGCFIDKLQAVFGCSKLYRRNCNVNCEESLSLSGPEFLKIFFIATFMNVQGLSKPISQWLSNLNGFEIFKSQEYTVICPSTASTSTPPPPPSREKKAERAFWQPIQPRRRQFNSVIASA